MEAELFSAIEAGDIETSKTLLSQGTNIDAKDSNKNSLVHKAILKRNEEILKLLINAGANVNSKNVKGQTPLYTALNFRNHTTKCKFVKLLVDAGAEVNDLTFKESWRDGRRALHEAAATGNAELVRILIGAGAKLNVRNRRRKHERGWSALHYAVINIFSEDPELFEVLLEAGEDVNARDYTKQTPLHLLAIRKPKVASSFFKIIKVFIKYNADFYARDEFMDTCCTPINRAANVNNLVALKALVVFANVDVDTQYFSRGLEPTGETSLHKASYNLDLPTIKFLLEKGANINALDRDNKSPLFHTIGSMNRDPDFKVKKNHATVKTRVIKYLFTWYPDVNAGQNILNPYSCKLSLPDNSWKVVLEQLAKFKLVHGRTIDLKIMKTIFDKPKYNTYFNQCCKEMKIIIEEKPFHNSHLNFFNLLQDEKHKLFKYSGNKDLVNDYKSRGYADKLPIFGGLIDRRFSRTMEMRCVWDQAAENLSDVLPINVDPADRVISNILKFLNFGELQKLTE